MFYYIYKKECKMNFIYNKNIKGRIFTYKTLNIKNIISNIFLDSNYVAYVQEEQFIGAVDKNSILNFDSKDNLINNNYKTITFNELDNENLYNYAIMNNTFAFPILKDNKIVEEYIILDRPTNIFSMDKERWIILYQNNDKIVDYIKYKNYQNIYVCGSYADILCEYFINKGINCKIIDKSYDTCP